MIFVIFCWNWNKRCEISKFRRKLCENLPNKWVNFGFQHKFFKEIYCFLEEFRRVVKKWIFYGEADCKGGSATSVLTVNKCENFVFFLTEIWFFDNQNTFYLIVQGLKNAFFTPFLWLSKWGASLLQMMIQRDRPLANGHPEGPSSCKWWSGGTVLLQMIIWTDWPLANDDPEGLASCKWSSGGSGLFQMMMRRAAM